ncbi:unnamed protein product [Rotaria sordida]|uniref:Arf-GAP domain-containing protein n=1 Tax=Rotaria sordida TaxID=392033 RepID=A0A819LK54_9BILA|nr:unnamed protein product [Rotaria sordida]
MASRSEREKSKMQEKYQLILSQMLKEEDNKYCVDCDTKSPRWASWNIGVFICIRCAGFHRNLGVHISKVKSVNLDSWTGEQIASMQAMGNSRARAVYEANLPDGFRRPQADSTLESFIRAKYEQRKWIAKEWIPPEITVPIDLIEAETNQRRVETKSDIERTEKNTTKLRPFTIPLSTSNPVRQIIKPLSPPSKTSTIEDNTHNLLNLDEPSSPLSNNTTTSTNIPSSDILDPLNELFTTSTSEVISMNNSLENAHSSSNNTQTNNGTVMSNEKIMALFNTLQVPTTTPSGMNIRPSNPSFPGFTYSLAQHSNLVPPQKSVSFSNNLYQQATNFGFQAQQGHPYHVHSALNYNNPNSTNPSTLQSPTSTFTHGQLNSQFMPFSNTKSNTSGVSLISNMTIRPVTEYMPTSSDTRWQ